MPKRKMYRGPKSKMWNEETREAMFWILQEKGLPMYSVWQRIMRPGVNIVPTSDYERIFEETAAEMNKAYSRYLLRSPDRRRWEDQMFTATGIEAQAAFAIQQGNNYNGGLGYNHDKKGHLNTTINCLRAALNTGFMSFDDIASSFHKYVVAASKTEGNDITEDVVKEVESLPKEYVVKKSKEVLNVEETPSLSAREQELVSYAIRALTDLIKDGEYIVVDPGKRALVDAKTIEKEAIEYVKEFAPLDLAAA